MSKIKIPELLSPAGSFTALISAVENGCDAVYLGGKQFSARFSADNFGDDELSAAIDYCHLRGVKTYITVNTLYKNTELDDLLNFIDKMYRQGADAFILQDIGAASLINSNFPGIPLHASTQTGIADRPGAEFLAEMGFSRLNLARELSLPEIKSISGSNIETEVFIHGALCVCYSGQCRLSGIIGGRSGNRGRCAQPCRLAYELLSGLPPDQITIRKDYLLSPRDIMTLDILPEIIETGVSSLKIEGRMKSPEYVALTTKMYRDALDAIKNGLPSGGSEFSVSDLTQIFNRGGSFSTGYFKSFAGSQMMSPLSPKSAGLQVGVVESYKAGKCLIALEKELVPGDGIEIWTRFEPHAGTNINKNYPAESKAAINMAGDIHPGDPVYRSFDKSLDRRLKKLYQKDTRKIRVGFSLRAKVGEKIVLKLTRGETAITVENETILCPAQSSPVTPEQILRQVMKSGGTTFELVPENIEIGDNIFLNIGAINALRREAIEKFSQEYLSNTRRENGKIGKFEEIEQAGRKKIALQADVNGSESHNKNRNEKKISVLVRKPEQFEAALSEHVDRIYIEAPEDFFEKIPEYKKHTEQNNIELFACLPYISRENGVRPLVKKISYLIKHGIDGFLARTYGQVQMLRDARAVFVADHTLNIFNSVSKGFWAGLSGAVGVTFSTESGFDEIVEIAAALPECYNEMIVYGYHVLMVTHQCPVGNYASGGKTTGKTDEKTSIKTGKFCGLRNQGEGYTLRDRKGIDYPIRTDCENCTALILSGEPISMLNKIPQIKESHVEGLRLMFNDESRNETAEVISTYINMIKSVNGPNVRTEITSGRFYRGVQ